MKVDLPINPQFLGPGRRVATLPNFQRISRPLQSPSFKTSPALRIEFPSSVPSTMFLQCCPPVCLSSTETLRQGCRVFPFVQALWVSLCPQLLKKPAVRKPMLPLATWAFLFPEMGTEILSRTVRGKPVLGKPCMLSTARCMPSGRS